MQFACAPEPPANVVIVTLDTTRVDHLSTYGYDRETSPRLTALAEESVRFTRAWSTSPWTLPSHASLFTGLFPPTHGAHFDPQASHSLADAIDHPLASRSSAGKLDDRFVTLAELVAERGYRTGAFVAGPWLEATFGLLQGFEHVDDDIDDVRGRRGNIVTDRALEWLAGIDADERYFLFVNYFDAHYPFDPAPGFDDYPRARDGFDADPLMRKLLDGRRRLSEHEREVLVDRYDGEIRYADEQLGRLLDAVAARPGGRNTLIIVTADHGEAFGEGGRYFHTYWLSQELLRVPLVVRYPDRRGAGSSDDSLFQLTDVLPIVAAELSLTLPEEVEGRPRGERKVAFADLYRDRLAVSISPQRFDRDLTAAIRWPLKLVRSDRGDESLARVDGGFEVPAASTDAAGPLAAALEARPASAHAPLVHPVVDPETEAVLRELGYVE